MKVKLMAHDELMDEEVFIGAVMTNHGMTIEEVLDLAGSDKQEVIEEYGFQNLYTVVE